MFFFLIIDFPELPFFAKKHYKVHAVYFWDQRKNHSQKKNWEKEKKLWKETSKEKNTEFFWGDLPKASPPPLLAALALASTLGIQSPENGFMEPTGFIQPAFRRWGCRFLGRYIIYIYMSFDPFKPDFCSYQKSAPKVGNLTQHR